MTCSDGENVDIMLEILVYSRTTLKFNTVIILKIGTDRSEQTVEILIRPLQKEQSDQGLHCLQLLVDWHQSIK